MRDVLPPVVCRVLVAPMCLARVELHSSKEAAMAERRDIHVVPNGDGWAVKREDEDRPLSTHSTQAEAVEAGRSLARNEQAELLVHSQSGQIRDRSTYGHDPREIPG